MLKTASMEAELRLYKEDKAVAQLSWEPGRQLSNQLLRKIEELLRKHGAAFEDLTSIVVFEGPGSFTSLRIGLTVANTIAYALQIPIVGASSDDWFKQGLAKLELAKAGFYVMPQYGAEANITKPKK
jgi:tRNA threonylcarbamoyladenosine biosynthesis protein TsaB